MRPTVTTEHLSPNNTAYHELINLFQLVNSEQYASNTIQKILEKDWGMQLTEAHIKVKGIALKDETLLGFIYYNSNYETIYETTQGDTIQVVVAPEQRQMVNFLIAQHGLTRLSVGLKQHLRIGDSEPLVQYGTETLKEDRSTEEEKRIFNNSAPALVDWIAQLIRQGHYTPPPIIITIP